MIAATHIPFCLEFLEIAKCLGNGLIGKYGLILLQRALTYLRVVCLWNRILQECFL